jgi:hypothetical protein
MATYRDNTWTEHKMTRDQTRQRHMSGRNYDTWRNASVPYGLTLAHHVSVPFAARDARHITCQRGWSHVVCQRVWAMSFASMDGAISAANMDRNTWIRLFCDVLRCVMRPKYPSMMNFFHHRKNHSMTFWEFHHGRTNLTRVLWWSYFHHKFITELPSWRIWPLQWRKSLITEALISTSDGI